MNQSSQSLSQYIFQNSSMLRDLAMTSGLLYRYKENGKEVNEHCPCTLIPKSVNFPTYTKIDS